MIRIIDGHPVPYALTVTSDHELHEAIVRRHAEEWLAVNKPEMHIISVSGNYVWYRPAITVSIVEGDQDA